MNTSSPRSRRLSAGLFCLVLTMSLASCGAAGARVEPKQRQVLAALPLDPEAAAKAWAVTGALALEEDDLRAAKVYGTPSRKRIDVRSKVPFAGAYAVEAVVRLPARPVDRRANVTLQCGVRGEARAMSFGCQLAVVCSGRSGFYANSTVSPHVAGSLDKGAPPKPVFTRFNARERFPLDKISPVWREPFRIEIENAMASLPEAGEVWRRLRMEVRPGSVRIYHNGFLVASHEDTGPVEGDVRVVLTGPARLASLEVERLDAAGCPFVPVPLQSVCNAAGAVDVGALAPGGQLATVRGMPFLLPRPDQKADHVDVGQSVFHYRMESGYRPAAQPRYTWPSPALLDPGRIMLTVPNHAYKRLWIIAASDGEPSSVPELTVRFFRPAKGWPLDCVARVPEFSARTGPEGARRIAAKMKDGTTGSLWLIPVDVDPFALSSDFRNEGVLSIELTKQIKDFRAFPDPCNYGSFQGGLPSAVRLYGLTLEKAPVSVIASGDRGGNTYTHPERPTWVVDVQSQTGRELNATVTVDVTDRYGKADTYRTNVTVPAGGKGAVQFEPAVGKWGLYRVRTTVECEGLAQSRSGTFLILPPDRRKENAKTSRWGLWCWMGGHGTNPSIDDNLRLLYAVGARTGGRSKQAERAKWGIGPDAVLSERGTAAFATKDPYDPAEYAKYSEEFGKKIAKLKEGTPDLEYISIFAEHSISLRVTHGPPPYAWGEGWWEYDAKEKSRIRSHTLAAKAAFEGCRKYAPGVKLCFGHCAPQFGMPFMREKFPTELFDAFGMDSPQFERMAERPPRAVEPNLLYFMDQEMKRLGYEDKERVHLESYFPSSHRLALGHRVQADNTVRTAVLSLALGSDRFLSCWSLHDCEDYWGTQHYGCVGLIGRAPEFNPKPAAAAFATMTQVLDSAKYDGFLPTGSRTAYCVRFKAADRLVYCLWTVRGTRSVSLSGSEGSELILVDENGNPDWRPRNAITGAPSNAVRAEITPTPIWVVVRGGEIEKAECGPPAYTEAPGEHRLVLDGFEGADWANSAEPYLRFAENSWDVRRLPGPMKSERALSPKRHSKAWKVTLTEAPPEKPFVGWYGVFTPPKPILIPGKAKALGIWAKGNSGWGRIVYEVVDAKGETYLSCGTKDAWNCDDVHSWSYFNFDGWRYMEFPLPGNAPGDDYREADYVWWGHDAEGVVDLPLKLTKVIIEMQGHQIYVDKVFPVENPTIELDDLMAVYEGADAMTEGPVALQRAAAAKLSAEGAALPNPIKDLAEKGVGAPTEILKLYPPDQRYAGTQIHVAIKPVAGAKEYQVWVSAYPDGRGAQALAKGAGTEPLVSRLKPNFPLYFFVTYTDAEDKASKPSAVRKTMLKDEFPMK